MASVTVNPSIGMRIPQRLIDTARSVGDEAKAVVAPETMIRPVQQIGDGLVKGDLNAIGAGARAALPSLLRAGRNGAIFSGVVSLAENAYKVFKHERTLAQAGGLVVADTATGAVGGVAAATASGIGMAALGALGLAGLPLTLLGAAIGLGGYLLVDHFAKSTGIYQKISNTVKAKIEEVNGSGMLHHYSESTASPSLATA